VRAARNIAIIAVIAAAFAFLPGGGSTVNVILAILGMVFAVLIGLFAARLYREHRFTLDSLTDLQRIVLYSSIGLAALDFVAWQRLLSSVDYADPRRSLAAARTAALRRAAL